MKPQNKQSSQYSHKPIILWTFLGMLNICTALIANYFNRLEQAAAWILCAQLVWLFGLVFYFWQDYRKVKNAG